RFRPLGDGVEQVFRGVPHSAQYVSRLLPVYHATSGIACAQDMYFVVRTPVTTTTAELQSLGYDFVLGLRDLAAVIGNKELSDYLAQVSAIQVVPKAQLNRTNNDDTIVLEAIGEWVIAVSDAADQIPQMREAFYSVACDYFLAYYLQWPYLQQRCSQDV